MARLPSDWLTAKDTLEPYWPACELDPQLDADALTLASLLAAAREQCEAFAPALADDDEVPESYRRAQALQARALYRAGLAGSGDQIGGDGLAVTVYPMDWTVKNLLRPTRGRPVIA